MANQQKYRKSNQRRSGGTPFGPGVKPALAAASVVVLVLLFRAHPVLTVLGAAAAAAAYVKFWLLPRRSRTARAGVEKARTDKIGNDAETSAQKAVDRTPGLYTKLTSLNLGRNGDCDIAALTASGVAAIEVKAGGGVCGWDGNVLTSGVQRRVVHGSPNPVAQVRIQADLLSKATGRQVLAIVCVNQMSNQIRVKGGRGETDVLICGAGYLPKALQQPHGAPLSAQDAERMAKKLQRASAQARPMPPRR